MAEIIAGRDAEFIATITWIYSVELGRVPDPEGLANWLWHARRGMTGDQIRQAVHDSPEGVAYRSHPPPPPAPSVPHLEVRGNDFVDVHGQRVVFAAVDGFLDYRLWLDGREAALDPFMLESVQLGFQVRRVFLAGSVKQNGVLDLYPSREPDYYAQLGPFTRYQNDHGIIPLLTVFVDSQDVMPNASDRLRHWQRVNRDLRGLGHAYLISGGNQWSKNHFNPWDDVDDPGAGVIWSRGSDVDDTATPPKGAPASELHSTRVSLDRSLMDSVASPIDLRLHGASMVWMTEGPPWDENGDPRMAWKLGRGYSVDWGLAVMHNRQSQRGQLMKPGTRACAQAWVEGMRL